MLNFWAIVRTTFTKIVFDQAKKCEKHNQDTHQKRTEKQIQVIEFMCWFDRFSPLFLLVRWLLMVFSYCCCCLRFKEKEKKKKRESNDRQSTKQNVRISHSFDSISFPFRSILLLLVKFSGWCFFFFYFWFIVFFLQLHGQYSFLIINLICSSLYKLKTVKLMACHQIRKFHLNGNERQPDVWNWMHFQMLVCSRIVSQFFKLKTSFPSFLPSILIKIAKTQIKKKLSKIQLHSNIFTVKLTDNLCQKNEWIWKYSRAYGSKSPRQSARVSSGHCISKGILSISYRLDVFIFAFVWPNRETCFLCAKKNAISICKTLTCLDTEQMNEK